MNRLAAVAFVVLTVGGCALSPWGGRQAPPSVRDAKLGVQKRTKVPAVHVVRRGETLSAIAWRYSLDYRSIARWNRIGPPYVIHPGQRLALRGSSEPPGKKAEAKAAPAPSRSAAATPLPTPTPRGGWIWPARGKVISWFGKGHGGGISIAGRRGDPVVAAHRGRVVYTGSGLVGYGRLIIIKHTERLLTAYAHNDQLLVREGQTVRAGQKIAQMGSTGAERVKLRFEVRRDGKPLNPMKYLPRRG